MNVDSLRADLTKYLQKHNLTKKFNKQLTIFIENPRHPSLHTEVLELQEAKLHSFRIDKKYRVIFGTKEDGTVEIIDINNHYK